MGPDEVALIREVVAGCAGLSWMELAHTVWNSWGGLRPREALKGRECREGLAA